jgi:uncharacterized protein (DUF1684 family)
MDGERICSPDLQTLGWVGGETLSFKDKTSETETYPKGRYLFIEPMPGGKVMVDFNWAFNPFCE